MIDGLRHLRGFLAVARLGSFTRASLELHVSQPALTVQIQQLESTLGVALLDRNNRKVALTRAGQELLIPIERVLIDIESIMSHSRDLAGLRRGIVTVVAVPSLAATLLPLALCEFSQAYPGVAVRLRDSVGNLVNMVKDGDADFGIGGTIQRDPAVTTQDLYTEPICVFAPMSHPVAQKQTITLSELVEHPVIVPQEQSSLRMILERALEQQGLSFRPFHETSHISTTIGMVNAGLGIAVLPFRAIDCFLSKNVRCIAIRKPKLERRVIILAKEGRSFSPAVSKLIEILRRRAHQFAHQAPVRRASR
jgi:LysR family transcriptional regulator, carnitine catabolism transcriptional activator